MPRERDSDSDGIGPPAAHPSESPTISYVGSYGFLAPANVPGSTPADIEPGVVSPPPAEGEVDVWLTEWQVSEDQLQVALGEVVSWALVPMDQDWIAQLFGDSRSVALRLDTYAAATREPDAPDWTRLSGVVVRIDQVSVTYVHPSRPPGSGLVSERGAAVVHTVASIRTQQPHAGLISGWIVRIRSAQGAQ